MNQFIVPTRDKVSVPNQAIFDNLNKVMGFVPNLFAMFAHSENGLGRYIAYQNAATSLSNKEKEAINLVVSEINGCIYCQSAHTFIGKMNGFPDDEILNLRAGVSSNEKLNTLAALAKDITENKGKISEINLDNFYAAGYNDENLVDTVLLISEKIAMNYLHNITDIPVDFPLAPALQLA